MPPMNRAILEPGEQSAFLESARTALSLTWAELAEVCGVSRKAVLDWRQESSHIRLDALTRLAELSGLTLPPIREILAEDDWHSRAGKLGAQKSWQTYGNPGTPEGRSRGGQVAGQRRRENPELYSGVTTVKEIREPELSPQLAELVGIILGDGNLNEHFVSVTLNLWHERDYAEFVARLFRELFAVEITPRAEIIKATHTVQVSSVRLVEFLTRLGLRIGSKVKQQVGVPAWVLDKEEFMRTCVRGLMDTDGGPYPHIYAVGGKTYRYVKLNFSNHSRPLLDDMKAMLIRLGFTPGGDGHTKVALNQQAEVLRYYAEIGTHNTYHLERFRRLGRECWGKDSSDLTIAGSVPVTGA